MTTTYDASETFVLKAVAAFVVASAWEGKIDRLVFQLCNLTNKTIRFIEGKT